MEMSCFVTQFYSTICVLYIISFSGNFEEINVLSSAILKICHHPDLILLSKFERLLLTFSRWSYFWFYIMIKSQKIINFKHIEIFRNHVRDWVELDLDHIESGYVELLALIGKGMYTAFQKSLPDLRSRGGTSYF